MKKLIFKTHDKHNNIETYNHTYRLYSYTNLMEWLNPLLVGTRYTYLMIYFYLIVYYQLLILVIFSSYYPTIQHFFVSTVSYTMYNFD